MTANSRHVRVELHNPSPILGIWSLHAVHERDIPFFFKQVTSGRSEQGADALGEIIHQMPAPPKGMLRVPESENPLPVLV